VPEAKVSGVTGFLVESAAIQDEPVRSEDDPKGAYDVFGLGE
jgi:hypothetical protein